MSPEEIAMHQESGNLPNKILKSLQKCTAIVRMNYKDLMQMIMNFAGKIDIIISDQLLLHKMISGAHKFAVKNTQLFKHCIALDKDFIACFLQKFNVWIQHFALSCYKASNSLQVDFAALATIDINMNNLPYGNNFNITLPPAIKALVTPSLDNKAQGKKKHGHDGSDGNRDPNPHAKKSIKNPSINSAWKLCLGEKYSSVFGCCTN